MTAEESSRQVLKTIADACDQESLARADGNIARYVKKETVLRDCNQQVVCRTPPGCARHWEERVRELASENEILRSNNDGLASENAWLVNQVELMGAFMERRVTMASVVPSEVRERGWQWRPTDKDTAFAPPFGTIRPCRGCGCLVAGGPTACGRCAEAGV